jgi:iron complex transport system permease protein
MALLDHPRVDPAVPDTVRDARRVPVRRHRLVVSGLSLALVAAFAARVLLGDFTFTVPDFFRVLFGAEIPGATYILMETKLPRAVLAVLVGFAFGISGALFQSTFRNPLASPDVIGVSLGASAAAVIAIVTIGLDGPAVSAFAVVGAVLTSVGVRLVAGRGSGYRLVLVGVGAAAALQSVVQYVFTRADEYDAQLVLRWLVGSVSGADWASIRVFTLILLVLLPVTFWLGRSLRITEMGDDTAVGLGVPRSRADLLLLLAVVLTACAVAAAGPVAFVAFLAGPIARSLNGGRVTLLGAGLTGATILVAADYAADYLLLDINFPVGVVTGAFGAPFLLWLLASGRTGKAAR